jgi:glucosamine--fructose-6-phosphate aminotransferase (isomerizing)
MCGIIAVSANPDTHNASIKLLDGLKLLQNRGYDSAGISMISPDGLITEKHASTTTCNAIEVLETCVHTFQGLSTGIGHTRWGTHGAKTDSNSHPHVDCRQTFSIVHNGIIENYKELRTLLEGYDYTFQSQTDSEVIANLLSYYYHHQAAADGHYDKIIQAIQYAITVLQGTYAVAMISTYTPFLYTFSHGSPLVVGYNTEKKICMASSELGGFGTTSLQYCFMKDKEIAVLHQDQILLVKDHISSTINPTVWNLYQYEHIQLSPAPYPSWCEKEIHEQVESVQRALNYGGRLLGEHKVKLGGLEQCSKRLSNVSHLVLLGCGTSLHAALTVVPVFRAISGFITVSAFDAGEFTMEDIPRVKTGNHVAFIFLSQSGETKDVQRCVEMLKPTYPLIGVINVVQSYIAREMDCGVYLNAGREVSVASTKAYTNMVVVLHLIAIWFSDKNRMNSAAILDMRRQIIVDMQLLSAHIQETLKAGIPEEWTNRLCNTPSCFLLGKGQSEFVAMEGALKIKEIAYIHAEGKSAASLKHGPFALIHNKLPILFINMSSKTAGHTAKHNAILNSYHEVASRDCFPIVICDEKTFSPEFSNSTIIPYNLTFGNILANIVLQKIALSVSYQKGIHPDFPRNLAKVVTVL